MQERELSTVIGHETVRAVLAKLIRRGTLPSTILFSGPEGIGKALIAREVGKSVLCEQEAADRAATPTGSMLGGCGTCSSCQLIESQSHPDFIFGDARSEALGDLDAIREVMHRLTLKSFRGHGRVVILDNAEYLSTQALNLLLKSLEEPRPSTWYILVAANPARFPPTIPSRCTMFSFGALAPSELEQIVAALVRDGSYPSEISREITIALSEGKVLSAETLRQLAERYESIATFHDLIASSNHSESSLALSKLVKENKEDLVPLFTLLRISARERMRSAPDKSAASMWSTHLTNVLLAEKLTRDRNLNGNYLLTAALVLGQNGEEESPLLQSVVR